MRISIKALSVVVFIALALTGTTWAQDVGRLSGKVFDSAGNPVRGVKITVASPDKPGFTEKAKTDKKGEFTVSVPDAEAVYEVRFDKGGFATMVNRVKLEDKTATTHEFTIFTPDEAKKMSEEGAALEVERGHQLQTFNEGVKAFTDGDLDTARAKLEEALGLGYDRAATLSALCLVLFKQESFEEAAATAEKALALNPEDTRALMIRYQAVKALKNDEKAAEAVSALKAAGLSRDMAMLVFNEGAVAYRSGRTAAAKAKFREARDLDPGIPEIHRALGVIALNEGRFSDARKAAESILELEPGDAAALKMRFDASRLALDVEKLGPAATDYAAVDPAYVGSSLEAQATEVFEANKVDAARALLGVLIEVLPDYARAYYRLGLCDVNAGDIAAAKQNMEKFFELAPDDPDAAAARSMMEDLQ